MNDEALRSATRPGPDCPPVELLHTLLELPAGDPARLATESHLGQCPHCGAEIALLNAFFKADVRPEETAAVQWITSRLGNKPAPRTRKAWWPAWKIPRLAMGLGVAALAIGIAVSFIPGRPSSHPLPEFHDEVSRSRAVEVLSTPGSLSWKRVPSANRYELTVQTIDGTIVFHNFLTETSLLYPRPVVELSVSGKALLWRVVAQDAGGNLVADSGTLRLKPEINK